MKKSVIIAVCALTVLSLTGCAQNGTQLENIDTTVAVASDKVNMSDFKNDLEGLEGYFIKLNYIPANTQPTKMLSKVIGAVDGDRYIFSVNKSNVSVELYEYEPDALSDEGKRVMNEVKENGEFHVFGDKSIDGDVTFPATLSDNGKYLMIYTDGNNSEANQNQKKAAIEALKGFYSTSADTSKPESSSNDTSKTESSSNDTSKTESSANDTSKTESSSNDTSKNESSANDTSKTESSATNESKSE